MVVYEILWSIAPAKRVEGIAATNAGALHAISQ
jgi:hypothetical protein